MEQNHKKENKLEKILAGILIGGTMLACSYIIKNAIDTNKKWDEITQKAEYVCKEPYHATYAFIDLDKNGEYEEIYLRTLFIMRPGGAYIINKIEMEKDKIQEIIEKNYTTKSNY